MRFTAIRTGRQLAITTGNARNAVPAEAPRQEGLELIRQAVERWHEERCVQRLLHGEDPDSGEDSASAEEESSEERDVPPEREDPPELTRRSGPTRRSESPSPNVA